MATRRRGIARIKYELTAAQELELLLGTGGRPSHFRDDAECLGAWTIHRAAVLEMSPAGKRPTAWWDLEARERRPQGGEETLRLLDMDVIGDDEMRELRRQWRFLDKQARNVAEVQPQPGRLFEETYHERRRYYGIPRWYESEEGTG